VRSCITLTPAGRRPSCCRRWRYCASCRTSSPCSWCRWSWGGCGGRFGAAARV